MSDHNEERRTATSKDRAFMHGLETEWNAHAALQRAYQVDTGNDLDLEIPDWRELDEDARRKFALAAAGPMVMLGQIVRHVTRNQ